MGHKFDLFVLPFTLGLIYMLIVLVRKYVLLIRRLSPKDQLKTKRGFLLSRKLFTALNEIFRESLLHVKLFRKNPFLGYMHMSFAFGWFMLIVMGNLESRLHNLKSINPPYIPIFYKFFHHSVKDVPFTSFFSFTTDFLLLAVLVGLMLAIIKRIWKRLFGLKKGTKMKLRDKFAMTSLWLIFPLRLLAESFTAGKYHNGGFLTESMGNVFSASFPTDHFIYPAWWAYSCALGIFFVYLPYSRYMHIPTEAMLIFLRHFGIKDDRKPSGFAEFEVLSCPRCGLCIDVCQLNTSNGNRTTQAVYFIRAIREGKIPEENTFNCLMCGRCLEVCPVGINTNALRVFQRQNFANLNNSRYMRYEQDTPPRADVIYFAGCMTHLTPSIKTAVTHILDKAGVNYLFIDEKEGVCCGRPMMLSGNTNEAKKMIDHNTTLFRKTGAEQLVTSCPICYKVFREEYQLNMEIMHHSQYFSKLIHQNKISLRQNNIKAVYHDPCELGRGLHVYDAPRELLEKTTILQHIKDEGKDSLCCGGSLGSLVINKESRDKITHDTLLKLTKGDPDIIVTSCPLCKKTFAKSSPVPVKDLSEIISQSIRKN